jgi:hypothetical protein
MCFSENLLRSLLWYMSGPRPFFVLGAGASYGLAPTTAEMRSLVKEDYLDIGIYPFGPPEMSDLFRRTIGSQSLNLEDFQEVILQSIPPATLEILVQRSLAVPHLSATPNHYAVFNLVSPGALIFNFNLDGLATRYLGHRHLVLTPHGTIDSEIVHDPELIEATATVGLILSPIRPKLLPGREPSSITREPAYGQALAFFPTTGAVVFIGYSFGQFGRQFDDVESFSFLVDLLRRDLKPVCVVSPHPEEVTDLIEYELKRRIVLGVPARWESLSRVLCRTASERGCDDLWSLASNTNLLLRRYGEEEGKQISPPRRLRLGILLGSALDRR